MSVVLRSWVVLVLSAFIVSAKETTLFAHNVLQSTIKFELGIEHFRYIKILTWFRGLGE